MMVFLSEMFGFLAAILSFLLAVPLFKKLLITNQLLNVSTQGVRTVVRSDIAHINVLEAAK